MKKLLSAFLSVVLVAALLVGCTNGADSAANADATSEKWDRETDFLIVGYGLAGEAAALEANDIDPEADILVLEKMPENLAGGNSIASGQTFIVPSENGVEGFKEYIRNCNQPNPIPEEYLDFMANAFADQIKWVQGTMNNAGYEVGYVGGGPLRWGSLVVEFAEFPGAGFEGTSAHCRKANSGTFENGGVWHGFDEAVKLRDKIEVAYSTPALDLIQDPVTKEVKGVLARDPDGKEIRIKANKGVLLACGGFENNLEMQRNYHGMDRVYTAGTPGNTGDGIKMLAKAGAKMWHMNNQTQSGGFWLGIKTDDYDSTFMRNMTFKSGSWIEVACDNNRFYNESKDYHRQHMKYKEFGRYTDLKHEKALPVHLIFDEKLRTTDSVASQWLSWPITTEGYQWSADNTAEIEKGWIVKADTIEELAEKIGRDPAELKATIDNYNKMCEEGVDKEFGRDPATMEKIDTAPYYAVELVPTLVATTGGAERNTHSQVLDWDGNPIPNLYEAGELGSYVSNLYQNGVFLSEAIASGRAAAQDIFGGVSSVTSEIHADGTEPEAPKAVEDGTYDVQYKNDHGEVKLSVTIKDGKFSAIEVVEGKDALFMDEEQFAAYVESVIAADSSEVDAIAGATLDCQGISHAINEVTHK